MEFDFVFQETESDPTLLVEVSFFNFDEDDILECDFVVIDEDGDEVGEDSYNYMLVIDEIYRKAMEITFGANYEI